MWYKNITFQMCCFAIVVGVDCYLDVDHLIQINTLVGCFGHFGNRVFDIVMYLLFCRHLCVEVNNKINLRGWFVWNRIICNFDRNLKSSCGCNWSILSTFLMCNYIVDCCVDSISNLNLGLLICRVIMNSYKRGSQVLWLNNHL